MLKHDQVPTADRRTTTQPRLAMAIFDSSITDWGP